MATDRATRHIPFHVVREALDQPGCPLCRLAAAAAARELEALSYDLSTSEQAHQTFRRALGPCALHGRQWLAMRNSLLAAAILYRGAASEVLSRLDQVTAPSGGGLLGFGRKSKAGAGALAADDPCPACLTRDATAVRGAEVLLDHLHEPDTHAAYLASAGLCLPHLRVALAAAGSKHRASLDTLRERMAAVLRGLDAELAEYIRKHDYRYQGEAFGDERDAPERTLTRFTGEPGQF